MKKTVLLAIKQVKKYYFQKNKLVKKALEGVSLNIYEGEIISFLGVNGAGKTTLSSIIATLHPATEGDILLHDVSIYKDIVAYRRLLGFCPQVPNLNLSLTVKENLAFAGRYYQISEQEIQQKIEYLAKELSFTSYLDHYSKELSGGYKQRVMIARELMHDSRILILDEPTVALDPQVRRQLWNIIKQLKAKGITIILTTHYIEEAEELSDRVCILDQGNVKFLDTPQNLKNAFQKGKLEEVFLHITQENQLQEQ